MIDWYVLFASDLVLASTDGLRALASCVACSRQSGTPSKKELRRAYALARAAPHVDRESIAVILWR
jgi:hypothetical protein